MTEELRKCASVFDIDIFIYKDMEHGTCGEYMGSVNVVAKKHTNKLLNEWLDDKYSTCIEISNNGEKGLIMRDFARA